MSGLIFIMVYVVIFFATTNVLQQKLMSIKLLGLNDKLVYCIILWQCNVTFYVYVKKILCTSSNKENYDWLPTRCRMQKLLLQMVNSITNYTSIHHKTAVYYCLRSVSTLESNFIIQNELILVSFGSKT